MTALTTALAGDKAGKALPATLDEVEPLVLAEGAMTVGDARSFEQHRDGSDVRLSHPALDLDMVHLANIPPRRAARVTTIPACPAFRARQLETGNDAGGLSHGPTRSSFASLRPTRARPPNCAP